MNKKPEVERDWLNGTALTGECATKWHLFLADEYSFAGDALKAHEHSLQARSMQEVTPASVYDPKLEEEITKWTTKKA